MDYERVVSTVVPLVFAAIVSIVYMYANKFKIKHKSNKQKIVSFAAGVSITYLLLEFYPRFTQGAFEISKYLFLSVLLGFTIHHVIEKEIYLHHHKHGLVKMLSREENIFSYVYHMIVGMVMVYLARISLFEGALYFATIFSYTFVSTLPTKPHKQFWKSLTLSSSTLIGAIIGVVFADWIPLWVEFVLMGLAIGVLMFTVVRHHIPFGRNGRADYFVIGFVSFAVLIILGWGI
jgi:hypothetical protein